MFTPFLSLKKESFPLSNLCKCDEVKIYHTQLFTVHSDHKKATYFEITYGIMFKETLPHIFAVYMLQTCHCQLLFVDGKLNLNNFTPGENLRFSRSS